MDDIYRSKRTTAIVKVRYNSGACGDAEKGSGLGYILNIATKEFSGGLDIECEIKWDLRIISNILA